jgi:hypothetical protein
VDAHLLSVIVHVSGGGIALLAGAATLAFRKGGRAHIGAGTLFCAAMAVVLTTGGLLAAFGSSRFVAVNALFALYLVATARAAARRREGGAGRFERLAPIAPLACAAGDLWFGIAAAHRPAGRLDGFPAAAYFGFVGFALLAAALDLNFILRARPSRAQRIARHAWRMSVPLFMAAGSLFLGQPQALPAALRGSALLFVPVLTPLAAMLFWLLRLRFFSRANPAIPRP